MRISPASVNDDGVTSLHRAAEHGSTAVLRWLIEGASSDPFVKVRPSKGMLAGRTLLHFAVPSGGRMENIKYLIDELKFDIGVIQMVKENRIVYLASEEGSVELVRYLIEEKGCDPLQEIPAWQLNSRKNPSSPF